MLDMSLKLRILNWNCLNFHLIFQNFVNEHAGQVLEVKNFEFELFELELFELKLFELELFEFSSKFSKFCK